MSLRKKLEQPSITVDDLRHWVLCICVILHNYPWIPLTAYFKAQSFNSTLTWRLPHFVTEHPTDRNAHHPPRKHTQHVQKLIYIVVFPFRLVLNRTTSAPTSAPKYILLRSDENFPTLTYKRLHLVEWTTDMWREGNRNLSLSQRFFIKHHDRHVFRSSIIKMNEEAYLTILSLSKSAAK